MESIQIEKEMYKIAIDFIKQRFPAGWGGAGVVHTEEGHYFLSVALENANGSVVLCIETGAMCEAHKYNEKITHCLCVVRDDETSPFKILSPCGVCQERLRYWGEEVKVGISTEDHSLAFVKLSEMQPHHWTKAYPKEELEHFEKLNIKLIDR